MPGWLLAQFGPVSSPVIRENVHERLQLRPSEALPLEQAVLENEIVELLRDRRLSASQAQDIEREVFGNDHPRSPHTWLVRDIRC